jgi:hypothetical protein
VRACQQLSYDLQALTIGQLQDCIPIASPYEPIDTVMFGNTKHATKMLVSKADTACTLKFELAAPLRTFSAENQVSEFLKNSGPEMNKTTRLTDSRAIAARDSEGGLVKLVKKRPSCALASKRAGEGCSTAA